MHGEIRSAIRHTDILCPVIVILTQAIIYYAERRTLPVNFQLIIFAVQHHDLIRREIIRHMHLLFANVLPGAKVLNMGDADIRHYTHTNSGDCGNPAHFARFAHPHLQNDDVRIRIGFT